MFWQAFRRRGEGVWGIGVELYLNLEEVLRDAVDLLKALGVWVTARRREARRYAPLPLLLSMRWRLRFRSRLDTLHCPLLSLRSSLLQSTSGVGEWQSVSASAKSS